MKLAAVLVATILAVGCAHAQTTMEPMGTTNDAGTNEPNGFDMLTGTCSSLGITDEETCNSACPGVGSFTNMPGEGLGICGCSFAGMTVLVCDNFATEPTEVVAYLKNNIGEMCYASSSANVDTLLVLSLCDMLIDTEEQTALLIPSAEQIASLETSADFQAFFSEYCQVSCASSRARNAVDELASECDYSSNFTTATDNIRPVVEVFCTQVENAVAGSVFPEQLYCGEAAIILDVFTSLSVTPTVEECESLARQASCLGPYRVAFLGLNFEDTSFYPFDVTTGIDRVQRAITVCEAVHQIDILEGIRDNSAEERRNRPHFTSLYDSSASTVGASVVGMVAAIVAAFVF